MLKLMGKKIFTIYAENFCLSKPVSQSGQALNTYSFSAA